MYSHHLAALLPDAVGAYLTTGIIVCTLIRVLARRPLRRSFASDPLLDAKHNIGNTLYSLVALMSRHSIVFLLEITFWPIWIIWLLILRITRPPAIPSQEDLG
jgi:hypothetical protein